MHKVINPLEAFLITSGAYGVAEEVNSYKIWYNKSDGFYVIDKYLLIYCD